MTIIRSNYGWISIRKISRYSIDLPMSCCEKLVDSSDFVGKSSMESISINEFRDGDRGVSKSIERSTKTIDMC